jgi:hypothetical protein
MRKTEPQRLFSVNFKINTSTSHSGWGKKNLKRLSTSERITFAPITVIVRGNKRAVLTGKKGRTELAGRPAFRIPSQSTTP